MSYALYPLLVFPFELEAIRNLSARSSAYVSLAAAKAEARQPTLKIV